MLAINRDLGNGDGICPTQSRSNHNCSSTLCFSPNLIYSAKVHVPVVRSLLTDGLRIICIVYNSQP